CRAAARGCRRASRKARPARAASETPRRTPPPATCPWASCRHSTRRLADDGSGHAAGGHGRAVTDLVPHHRQGAPRAIGEARDGAEAPHDLASRLHVAALRLASQRERPQAPLDRAAGLDAGHDLLAQVAALAERHEALEAGLLREHAIAALAS